MAAEDRGWRSTVHLRTCRASSKLESARSFVLVAVDIYVRSRHGSGNPRRENALARAEGLERKRRADGERTRRTILDVAARLATVEGLDGLDHRPLGLAQSTGMSKSGLFAHFGSKEELQLATIAAAEEVFEAEVLGPAMAQPAGLARLRGSTDGSSTTSSAQCSPAGASSPPPRPSWTPARGGCARARWPRSSDGWMDADRGIAVRRGPRSRRELRPSPTAAQLAFEVNAHARGGERALRAARRPPRYFDMARRGIEARLR